MPEFVVISRFPSYRFAIDLPEPCSDTVARLQAHFKAGESRKTFVPGFSRYWSGEVSGATFTARLSTSAFGGNLKPIVEGRLEPTHLGTRLEARVRYSSIFFLAMLGVLVAAGIAQVSKAPDMLHALKVAGVSAWCLFVLFGIQVFEGRSVVKELSSMLRGNAA